jgi:hypothetical protein
MQQPSFLPHGKEIRACLIGIAALVSLDMVDGKRAQAIDAEAWPTATSQAAIAEHDSQRPWIVENNAAIPIKHALILELARLGERGV